MSGVAIEIKNYDELIDLLNRRLDELQLTRSTVDELGGLQENYISKCLRSAQTRKLGSVSGFTTFGVLGLRLFFLQDDDATARTLARRTPRKKGLVRRTAAPRTNAAGSSPGLPAAARNV
jgi:hypothetical protein